MQLTRILLPTDFSDTAGHALDYARDLAARFGASVHLLHVVSDPRAQDWAGEVEGLAVPDLLDKWKGDAERRLGASRARRRRDGPGDPRRPRLRRDHPLRDGQRHRPHRDGHARPRSRPPPAARKRGREGGAEGALPRAHGAATGSRLRDAVLARRPGTRRLRRRTAPPPRGWPDSRRPGRAGTGAAGDASTLRRGIDGRQEFPHPRPAVGPMRSARAAPRSCRWH